MKTKKFPPAYLAVRGEGQGSFKILAEKLGKSKSTVSQTLRRGRLHYNSKIHYTQAINEVFGTNYRVSDLFPFQR